MVKTKTCKIVGRKVVCPESVLKIRRFINEDENPLYAKVVQDALKKGERILKSDLERAERYAYDASEIWENIVDLGYRPATSTIHNWTVGSTVKKINSFIKNKTQRRTR